MITILSSDITYKKVRSFVIKFALLILLLWVLYVQIVEKNDLPQLINQFKLSLQSGIGWVYLIASIILVPINWGLESIKWKNLVTHFQKFTLKESVFSVLSGVSVAIMTPGRIGEYGGRLIGISKKNRSKAILANLISSLSQNITNIGIGLISALIFIYMYLPVHLNTFLAFTFLSSCIITVLLLVYFRIDLLENLFQYLPKWAWINKISQSISSFKSLDSQSLFLILKLSTLRYFTYLTQYVLLLLFFGVTEDILAAFLGVSTIFFLQSNLPLPPALSILARGEMAIFLWSVFSTNVLGILAATFTLWIMNLVLPAILGSLIISQSRIFEE